LFCMLIVLLFAVIVVRGFIKMGKEQDSFRIIAVGGLLSEFGIQSIVNMGVAVNLLPAKGMTLPFLSYGGSSLVAMAGGMGMMLALTRKRFGQPKADRARGGNRYIQT
jgi:cell division protein FtsW